MQAGAPCMSTRQALKILQQIRTASSVHDLADVGTPHLEMPALNSQQHAAAIFSAAATALSIVGTLRIPPNSKSSRRTPVLALTCAEFVSGRAAQCLAGLQQGAEHEQLHCLATPVVEAFKDMVAALPAAGETAATQLLQPWSAQRQGAAQAGCAAAWMDAGLSLLRLGLPAFDALIVLMRAAPLREKRAGRRLFASVSSMMARLASAQLCSDAPLARASAVVERWRTPPADAWEHALTVLHASAMRSLECFRLGKGQEGAPLPAPSLLLLPGLAAAALHKQLAGRSCIPADPIAAAGHAGSGSSSSGGSGVSGASSSLLAAPAFHQALLRQVPCLHLMLQQPKVLDRLLSVQLQHRAVRACAQAWAVSQAAAAGSESSTLVPLLQVLVELAVLHAGVADSEPSPSVGTMLEAACLALQQPDDTAAATANRGPCFPRTHTLTAVQVAGLLGPVLHLLSAAVMHELCATAEGSSAHPLSPEQRQVMTGHFSVLVATVVLPVEPQHLAAAICKQPLRSLAALEIMLRQGAAALEPLGSDVATARAQQLLRLVRTVADACADAVKSGRLAATLQDGNSEDRRLLNNHLLSLLVSCLKCCSAAGVSDHGSVGIAVTAAMALAIAVSWFVPAPGEQSSGLMGGSCTSSSGGGSSCSIMHWMSLSGRCLLAASQHLMLYLVQHLRANTVGVRAMLGLQEGELSLATAAAAAAVIQAAGAASFLGTSDASQEHVAAAAAAAAGVGLAAFCTPSERNMSVLRHGSAAAADVNGFACISVPCLSVLGNGLAVQLAPQQQASCTGGSGDSSSSSSSSSDSSSDSGIALLLLRQLVQLAEAATAMHEQLDEFCGAALLAASQHYQQQPDGKLPGADDMLQCFTEAIQHDTGGINVLRGRRGQPDTRQHAVLSVLHHLQRLQQLGEAVCAALPPPSLCCANPLCGNVSGLSEMHLVWRRGVCGHCSEARFCSCDCLRAHWDAHRDPASLVAACHEACGGCSGSSSSSRSSSGSSESEFQDCADDE